MLNKQLKDAHEQIKDKDSTDLLDMTSKWSYENAKLQEVNFCMIYFLI